jgi:replicative DNA helicase
MSTKLMEKMMPNNIEAEYATLGSMLIDPQAIDQVTGFLRAEDFYRDANQTIYEAILALQVKRTNADSVTIIDELERQNKLDAVGGPGYIVALINQVPTSANIVYYARIVEQMAIFRRLIKVGGEIAQLGYAADDATVALDQAERSLFELSQRYLQAQSSDVGMSEAMNAYMDILQERYENRGRVIGVPTGYMDLDRLLGGLHRSDLDILAARTSIGKTTFALNIAYNAAMKFQKKIGIFSLEMSTEQLIERFLAIDAKMAQQKLRTGNVEDDDWSDLIEASVRLAGLGIRIKDKAGISLMEMRSVARRWVQEYGIELIIVDYLQLVESSEEKKRDNREQEVSRVSRGLKNIARELNVPVLALAQLSRALETRQVKVPQLSDLRESGSIEQEADVVMFIYRDEVYHPETERRNMADIIVAKHRSGPLGEVTLYFNQSQLRFQNLDVWTNEGNEEVAFAAEEEDGAFDLPAFPPEDDDEGLEEDDETL